MNQFDFVIINTSSQSFLYFAKMLSQRTVLLLDNNEYLQITGWMLGTQPSFCIVHPLGIKSNGETIYGVSIYVQMTDKELNTMQNSAK